MNGNYVKVYEHHLYRSGPVTFCMPSREAVARRVRIGARYNPKPHKTRDRMSGTYMETLAFDRSAYLARKREEYDAR